MRTAFYLIYFKLALSLATAEIGTNSAALAQEPDPTEKNIARVTAGLLQSSHFSHHLFDQEIANKFLDRYLDLLDGLHLHFLQSDLDEFAHYRTNLNVLTLRMGDISPCRIIFSRFLERVEQRVNYATNLVQTEKFDFTGHDRYMRRDRHNSNPPYAKDVAAAKDLWRDHLRSEYLEEKLSAPDMKFTGPVSLDSKGNPEIHLKKTKSQPLSLDLLPKEFFGADKKPLGSIRIEKNQTNAVVRVGKHRGENFKSFRKKIFSADGKELGTISFHRQTNELATAKIIILPNQTDLPKTTAVTLAGSNGYTAVIQLNQKNLPEILKTITNRYVRLLKTVKDFTPEEVLEFYLTSLAHAYDPHSDYMDHSQFDNFAIQMKLSLFGIGAVLISEEGFCKIKELVPGPAAKSKKIKPNDRIVAVAQADKESVDCIGMTLNKVVEMIRGPKGTEVRLTIIPADAADSSAREIVPLIRDQIYLEDQEAKAKIYETPAEKNAPLRLGVIDLPSFYGDPDNKSPDHKSPTADVARLLTRFKQEKVGGVILDLRRNGGGYLEEAISLTGLFITKGPVVQTKEPTGEITTDSDPDPSVLYDGPLIILTSRASASASEILAGALQDYGRALIVGDKATFGKGTVQTMQKLAPYLDQKHLQYTYDPGALKWTIRKFYRAGGSSTQFKGVVPDIILPSFNNYADFGETSLENALPWDEVPSADPQNLNRVKPFLTDLQKHSSQRIAKDKDFTYLLEDIEQYKKSLADKSVSLNEPERLAEKKDIETKLEARKKEQLARKKSAEKIFELTLKNVDEPGLKPPEKKTNEVASATSEIPALDDDPESLADAKVPAVDVAMEEAKKILTDYIALLGKSAALSKTP